VPPSSIASCSHLPPARRPPGRPPVPPLVRCIALVAIVAFTGCSSGRGHHAAPTFLEEFEGFPIYHGEPARPYAVLGAVYDGSAAQRGTSPMKRAAVAAARDQGADAIIVGVRFDVTGEPTNGGAGTSSSSALKWQHAVAIRWK